MGAHTSSLCPGYAFCPEDTWSVADVRLRNGSSLRGFARAQGKHDLQLQTLDGIIHSLMDAEYLQITREKASLMPPLAATAKERQDLIAYLSSLNGIPIEPRTAATETVSQNP